MLGAMQGDERSDNAARVKAAAMNGKPQDALHFTNLVKLSMLSHHYWPKAPTGA